MANGVERRTATGWLVKFGQTDFEGDVFTSETNFFLGRLGRKTSVPILYEHGGDEFLKLALLGEGTVTMRDQGLWIDASLEIPSVLGSALKRLSRDRLLGWSSGSAVHTVTPRERRGKPNHIKSWAIVEASLTTKPAMHLAHSRAMVKRFDIEQRVLELKVNLELNQYERIAEQIAKGDRYVAF